MSKTLPTLAKKTVCETVGALLLGIDMGHQIGKTIKGKQRIRQICATEGEQTMGWWIVGGIVVGVIVELLDDK